MIKIEFIVVTFFKTRNLVGVWVLNIRILIKTTVLTVSECNFKILNFNSYA